MSIAIVLHLWAAVIWVGGMFFAYMILRPAAGALEPPLRMPLWARSFGRFFPWVWTAVVLLPVTGYWMIFQMGGFAAVPIDIHLMQGLGIVMIMIYLHVFFAPYRRFVQAVHSSDWEAAAKNLAQIRVLVGLNLVLGLLTVAIASAGRYVV